MKESTKTNVLLFLIPLLIFAEIKLYGIIVFLMRQPSDLSVYGSFSILVLNFVFLFNVIKYYINYFSLIINKKTKKRPNKKTTEN